MRIPVIADLSIDTSVGGQITIPRSQGKNVIYGQRPDGSLYATQRPSVNIFEDASSTVSKTRGRGIYYWDEVGALYFVNDDTVYKGSYSAPLGVTMGTGIERVEMFVVGAYLVLLDVENNKGYTISSGASTTLVEITDVQFPPKDTPALTIARGGASLNGTLYVYCTNGTIHNSDVEDPTSWAGDFKTSEIESDPGVACIKHNNNIATFGTWTTEFFYDNANKVGSPLNVRTDIIQSIGCANLDTLWSSGNEVFFVGQNKTGDLSVFFLSNYQLKKISKTDLDTFLTTSVITDALKIAGTGFTAGGHLFYILTIYSVSTDIVPLTSLVYDSFKQTWGVWELAHSGINDCPLIQWTSATGTRAGQGILSNGDIITIVDDNNPQDTTEAQVYVLAGYVDTGYITDTSGTGNDIELEIIIGPADFETREYKYPKNLYLISEKTTSIITVSWSDQDNDSFNTGRTVDLSNPGNKLTRTGRFRSRNHKISYTGTNQIQLEAIEYG